MKHPSLYLTVLLLGAVPLAAAALDYGPNRTLLAAENGAPQLPGAQVRAASMGAMPKPDAVEADDTSVAPTVAPRVTPSASSPASAPRNHGPTASNKPRAAAQPNKPATEPGPATWQSLLPGSIQ